MSSPASGLLQGDGFLLDCSASLGQLAFGLCHRTQVRTRLRIGLVFTCGLTFELSGRHRIGAWPAKRMMTLAGSRAKCQAGGGPLERRVRAHLLPYAHCAPARVTATPTTSVAASAAAAMRTGCALVFVRLLKPERCNVAACSAVRSRGPRLVSRPPADGWPEQALWATRNARWLLCEDALLLITTPATLTTNTLGLGLAIMSERSVKPGGEFLFGNARQLQLNGVPVRPNV